MRFERVMDTGRTRPLLLDCERVSGSTTKRSRFVTKMWGLPEIAEFSLCHEFLGGALARLFGLAAPAPAVIHVSPELLAVIAHDVEPALHLKPGLAVGSEFLPNLQPFPRPPLLAADEMALAARLYAFDLLTQNPDRRPVAPNCGRLRDQIGAYDFEAAFSFRFAIPRHEPWRVSALPFCRNHLFFPHLHKTRPNWTDALSSFFSVSHEAVAEVCSTIPESWQAVGSEIDAHLAAVLPHWPEFVRELGQILWRSVMTRPYSYVVVQYVPDAGAGEFLNVGVIIYSQRERFIRLKVDSHDERLSQAFADFDGAAYRRAMVNLRQVFQDAQQQLSGVPLFEGDRDSSEWLRLLLPDLGASIATTGIRHGIASDLDSELSLLFDRMVESRKAQVDERPRRDDVDVWQQCEKHLRPDLRARLETKAFTTTSVKVTFEHAVKNGRWHAIQPVSMDFERPDSMQRKASQWVGTTIGLQDDPEFASIIFVIGKPARHSQALDRALALLGHLHERGEVIEEDNVEHLNRHIQSLLSGTH